MISDQELWERIRRADAEAFENFYRDVARPLQNFLCLYVGNRQTAEEISQEIFIELWQRPNGFNPARSTLKTYVFGIARHRAADWWRRNRPAGEASVPERSGFGPEARTLLLDALSRLEPEVRGILWLREVEGYSYDELAEILKIPVGTVRSRLFTAREDLRSIWKSSPSQT